MSDGYFHRVSRLSRTRFWINNPTLAEAKWAIAAGAVGCTTNPTFASKLLASSEDRQQVERLIDEAISNSSDDSRAAAFVQRSLVARLLPLFAPLHASNPLRYGFVSLQGDPYAEGRRSHAEGRRSHAEDDPANIIEEAIETSRLGANAIAKIPVTEAGLAAIDELVGRNIPIIATEVMAVSQAIAVCEAYRAASDRTGRRPPLFVTHITGIFDEHLALAAAAEKARVSSDALWQAGCVIARKIRRIMRERYYPGILLGGGARALHHFTEMVGGEVHVTINWKKAAEDLIAQDPPVVFRFDTHTPEELISELKENAPGFEQAYDEEGLTASEFRDYGPVAYFRSSFCRGWDTLIDTIRSRRNPRSEPASSNRTDSTGESLRESGPALGHKFTTLESAVPVEMIPGILRRAMSYNEKSMVCFFAMKAGAKIPLHQHDAVQNGYVLSGSVELFDEAGEKRIAGPGAGYVFDSLEKHGLTVLEDTELIECFSPMRSEYADRGR